MSRLDPQNREEAFSYQLEDEAKKLRPAALLGGEEAFERVLSTIEVYIKAYRNKKLRKTCKDAEKKFNDFIVLMHENYPELDLYKK